MTSATSLQLTALICVLAGTAWSQETRAILSGTVTDPQDAAVPRAAVELKNLDTNVVTKVSTNDAGVTITVGPNLLFQKSGGRQDFIARPYQIQSCNTSTPNDNEQQTESRLLE
jgi:hypothetical protein